jgi:hypothetical protein
MIAIDVTMFSGAERVAQVLEHLLSKSEALSSNPSTTKKKKNYNNHYVLL